MLLWPFEQLLKHDGLQNNSPVVFVSVHVVCCDVVSVGTSNTQRDAVCELRVMHRL